MVLYKIRIRLLLHTRKRITTQRSGRVVVPIAIGSGGLENESNNRGVAEWSIAAVLKTVVPWGTGGSNPSSSALQKVGRNSSLFSFQVVGATLQPGPSLKMSTGHFLNAPYRIPQNHSRNHRKSGSNPDRIWKVLALGTRKPNPMTRIPPEQYFFRLSAFFPLTK